MICSPLNFVRWFVVYYFFFLQPGIKQLLGEILWLIKKQLEIINRNILIDENLFLKIAFYFSVGFYDLKKHFKEVLEISL